MQPSADVQALIPEYRAALQQLRGQLDQARGQLEEAQADNKTLEQQVRRGEVRKCNDWVWALLHGNLCTAEGRCRVGDRCA